MTTRPNKTPKGILPKQSSERTDLQTFDWEEAENRGFMRGLERARKSLLAKGIDPKTRKPIERSK